MTGDYNIVTELAIAEHGAAEAIERLRLEIETLEAIHRGMSAHRATAGDPRVHTQSALEALDRCMDSLKETSR